MQLITVHGQSFYVDENVHSQFWETASSGVWEPQTFEVFNRFLRKEYSYLDIGSWIGPTVLYGAQLCKKVYAVEPDKIAFETLKRNVLMNGFENVSLFPCCIADVNGPLSFGPFSGQRRWDDKHIEGQLGDSMSQMYNKGETVEGKTLETFVSENSIQDLNFIKMDIEGGEEYVLPASRDFLAREKVTIYLSLHLAYFSDKSKLLEIEDVLRSSYPYIYNIRGERIGHIFKQYVTQCPYDSIIASTQPW